MSATKKRGPTRAKLTNQQIFLKVYATCGNLSQAALGAKVDVGAHYRWLEEPEYRQEFDKAHNAALDILAAEARRRALEGDEEPVIYQGGLCYERLSNGRKKQIFVRRKSDNLLMFLLKAGRPELYRDQWKGELKHTAVISQGPDLSHLSNEQLEQLNTMFRLTTGEGSAIESIAGSSPERVGETSEE